MKHTWILACLALSLSLMSLRAGATIHRVNNSPTANADFSSLTSAHDAASPGDTIYLEPSTSSYGSFTLTKKLVIYGNGYFLDENIGLQANMLDSRVDFLYFNEGSQGSSLIGVRTRGGYTCFINVDSIYITRCHIEYLISLANDVSDCVISQCYTNGISRSGSDGAVSNNYFLNNIMGQVGFGTNDVSNYFYNNIFLSNVTVYGSVFRNNIWNTIYTPTLTGSTVENNLHGGSNGLPSGSGNQNGVNMLTVFIAGGTTDGRFQLRPNSPALGAGSGGADCGVFGVPTEFETLPYRLSGIPNIPTIYEFEATVNGNNLDVIISTRSNN